ncbi:hypothetical protein Psuf_086100 [Phytohabitans suffuscus]|uniref:Uncharacterized protein n=1 Tax=Phytohabitans suffuscus TaxID=624315 RepID=A0A6F8YYS7_9ACTN|nr:hypothetical protein Psuf_086100 [Phytohabitans suffuscus]
MGKQSKGCRKSPLRHRPSTVASADGPFPPVYPHVASPEGSVPADRGRESRTGGAMGVHDLLIGGDKPGDFGGDGIPAPRPCGPWSRIVV